MIVFLADFLAIGVVLAVIWRRGRDRQAWTVTLARALTIAGFERAGFGRPGPPGLWRGGEVRGNRRWNWTPIELLPVAI